MNVPLNDFKIDLSTILKEITFISDAEILGFKPVAKNKEDFVSNFKQDLDSHTKVIELLPHDVPRFNQPVTVNFEAVS